MVACRDTIPAENRTAWIPLKIYAKLLCMDPESAHYPKIAMYSVITMIVLVSAIRLVFDKKITVQQEIMNLITKVLIIIPLTICLYNNDFRNVLSELPLDLYLESSCAMGILVYLVPSKNLLRRIWKKFGLEESESTEPSEPQPPSSSQFDPPKKFHSYPKTRMGSYYGRIPKRICNYPSTNSRTDSLDEVAIKILFIAYKRRPCIIALETISNYLGSEPKSTLNKLEEMSQRNLIEKIPFEDNWLLTYDGYLLISSHLEQNVA